MNTLKMEIRKLLKAEGFLATGAKGVGKWALILIGGAIACTILIAPAVATLAVVLITMVVVGLAIVVAKILGALIDLVFDIAEMVKGSEKKHQESAANET